MAKKINEATENTDVRIQQMNSGRWCVLKSGNKNPSKITDTQREAISQGREIAKRIGAQMVIFNKEGNERRRYYKS